MATGYFGKYSAIVTDNADPEKLGRLQVEVPTMFPGREWARPALPYGVFFLPDVKVNVWIEFEGGDTGCPLWTGVQYIAGSEWAKESDMPEKRVIRTPSGHVVMFDDKSGEEKIEITDGVNKHVVTLDSSGVKVTDGVNHHEVALTSSGVKITDGVNSNGVELSDSGATVKTAGGQKVELTPAMTTVDGGTGIVQVKGSVVQLAGAASAGMPVLRAGIDMGVGNLGAPVPLIGPGNATVTA
jgi:hypothetical protein